MLEVATSTLVVMIFVVLILILGLAFIGLWSKAALLNLSALGSRMIGIFVEGAWQVE